MKSLVDEEGFERLTFETLEMISPNTGMTTPTNARRRAKTIDDDREDCDHELPEEPPPGWAEP